MKQTINTCLLTTPFFKEPGSFRHCG